MKKTAVFVEGQTELILVRELLLKMFEYQNIRVECYALLNDKFNNAPYDYGDKNAENFFMIINAGNDNAVLSKIKNRAQGLCDKGFHKILGLRDVYSEIYKKMNNHQKTINKLLIERFFKAHQEQIDSMNCHDKIKFFFAIMEIEAWFLGFKDIFASIDYRLSNEYIKSQLNYDLDNDDPESTYYHPAKIVGNIFQLANKKYNKHEGDISPLINSLTKEHYNELLNAGKCTTFSLFTKELLN